MEAPCIYCHVMVDLDADCIVLTDTGDWAGYAHPQCQSIAETLAVEALQRQSA